MRITILQYSTNIKKRIIIQGRETSIQIVILTFALEMVFLRKHIAFRYFWVLMALHILNCSIDAPDALPDTVPENLSFNDIESISELLIEQFMGFENAVEEHDEPDSSDGLSFEIVKILLYCQPTLIFSVPQNFKRISVETGVCLRKDDIFTLFYPEIVSPPPQFS